MKPLKTVVGLIFVLTWYANEASASIKCVELLTGRLVCTDSDSGKTYERVDKLTGDSEWVVTQPGRDRHRDRGGHSYDNDHNRHWDRD